MATPRPAHALPQRERKRVRRLAPAEELAAPAPEAGSADAAAAAAGAAAAAPAAAAPAADAAAAVDAVDRGGEAGPSGRASGSSPCSRAAAATSLVAGGPAAAAAAPDAAAGPAAGPARQQQQQQRRPITHLEDDLSAYNFEYRDHTADVQIRAWGDSLEEAYQGAALGMYNYMTPLSSLGVDAALGCRRVQVSSHDAMSLLYDFLDELLFLFHTEMLVMTQLQVLSIDRTTWTLTAEGRGEKFDRERHECGTEIKAITYSAMQIHERPANEAEEDGPGVGAEGANASWPAIMASEGASAREAAAQQLRPRAEVFVIVDI